MTDYDLAIIGAGPGGYVAGIRAGQLGMKTALIEAGPLGGMCLNWGCIPSKALLESAWRLEQVRRAGDMGIAGVDFKKARLDWPKAGERMRRIVARLVKGIEFLEKKNKVEIIKGKGEPQGDGEIRVGDRTLTARNIILATGSRMDREPVKAAGDKAMEITAFLNSSELPGEAAVLGSGPVAVEFALLLALAGVKAALIAPDERLLPRLDGDLSAWIAKRLKKTGVAVYAGRTIAGAQKNGVTLDDDTAVPAAFVINASERLPALQSLKALDLELDGGFVRIDEFGRTSAEGVYAAGDVTGKVMLAHAASAQGLAAVNHIAGVEEPVDFDRIPWNIYTYPEIASIGQSEEKLKQSGVEYEKGFFPLMANSKAAIRGETDGFVKVLSERKYGEVLGVHIVAPDATDMIAEAAVAMRLECTALEIGSVVHAHPTLSETMLEAALDTEDRTIHI